MHYCNILTGDLFFFSILLCFWLSWVGGLGFWGFFLREKKNKNEAANGFESCQPPCWDRSGLTSSTWFWKNCADALVDAAGHAFLHGSSIPSWLLLNSPSLYWPLGYLHFFGLT